MDKDARIKELELLLRNEKAISAKFRERAEKLEAQQEALITSGAVSAPSGARSFLNRIKPSSSNSKRNKDYVEQKKTAGAHKKLGVFSGISTRPSEDTAASFKVPLVSKTEEEKKTIREAISLNRLLSTLESAQIQDIIDSMALRMYSAGDCVTEESADGEEFYVSATGSYEVCVDGNQLKTFGSGVVFGELAILYGSQRTATVRAVADSNSESTALTHSVWYLNRSTFQKITMRVGVLRHRQHLKFVKSIPAFSKMKETELMCLVDALAEERFAPGDFVIHQGALGETFYIVQDGTFNVMQRERSGLQQVIRTLNMGDTFGEKALDNDDVRTASVVAVTTASVLALDRSTYARLFKGTQSSSLSSGEASDFYEQSSASSQPSSTGSAASDLDSELAKISLPDFRTIGRLGAGGFGRVDLVQLKTTDRTFALKCMAKKEITARKQQAHTFSERDIQMSCRHPLIVRLHRTFRDTRYLYMLLEPCLGGEMWYILRQCGRLTECEAVFITACVVEAISYLHRRHIVFRDLKPGNMILDSKGFCKLVDFGFAKHLPPSVHKTWTFCGTPEYMAPEVVLHRGHNFSVDYWAIGILIFELLSGWPPFSSPDNLFIYSLVLSGFDDTGRFPAVDFPAKAKDLVLALCRQRPTERLGVGADGVNAIRRHPWFGTFSWVGLREHTVQPPIVPELNGKEDLSNFDQSNARVKKVAPEDISGWDEGF